MVILHPVLYSTDSEHLNFLLLNQKFYLDNYEKFCSANAQMLLFDMVECLLA